MLDGLINPVHIMIILAVVLLLFGPKRLPEMGQKVGQALRDFKSATSEIRSQTGIDGIADSVKDIKSSLSLTAIVSSDPAAGVAAGQATGGSPASPVRETGSPASAAPEVEPLVGLTEPVPLTSARAVVQNGALAQPSPVGQPLETTSPPATPATVVDEQSASGGGRLAIGDEGGVEAFGRLERRTTSSSSDATGD
jgi:sec-independent protein translocase protein TatA